MRFTYYWSRDKQKVIDALEHCFACGDISEGERPLIERKGKVWALTLSAI